MSPDQGRARLRALRGEARRVESRIREIGRRLLVLEATAPRIGGGRTAQTAALRRVLVELRERLSELRDLIARFRDQLAVAPSPPVLSEAAATHPILMLPARLETRFVRREDDSGAYDLLVRIYPDQIAIDSHIPELASSELVAASHYQDIGSDEERKAAWADLVRKFGKPRASWLARAPTDGAGEAQSVVKRPPQLRALPDYFMVRLYRGGEVVLQQTGAAIPQDLELPLNLSADEPDALLRGEKANWVFDFDEALEEGMAVKFERIAAQDAAAGYDEVVAVGVRWSTKPADARGELENLLESHLYTDGLSFPVHGTATNNTEEAAAVKEGPGLPPESEDLDSAVATWDATGNASRWSCSLGVGAGLLGLAGRGEEDATAGCARWMQQALWPATWGYFFRNLLPGALRYSYEFWDHYRFFVRASGPMPAIRAGKLPYGLLPAMSMQGWKPDPEDWAGITDLLADPANGLAFDQRAHRVLRELSELWLSFARNPDLVPRIGASDDPDQELIRILAMEPRSTSARRRTIFDEPSLAALFNTAAGVFFSGNPALNIAGKSEAYWRERWVEAWEDSRTTARELLSHLAASIGAAAPPMDDLPLLHLFSWGDGSPFPTSLVSDAPVAADTLADQLRVLLDNFNAPPASQALLLELFWRSLYLGQQVWKLDAKTGVVAQAIKALAAALEAPDESGARLSLDQLDGLLRDALDLSTHRLDAWITSFATKRLRAMRKGQPVGVYLGAYGWVEDLRLDSHDSEGFIHAPSIDQAKAAAVVHSAYLTHREEDGGNLARTDLSSRRLRNALELMQGIGPGQPVGAVLGFQFERDLHDRGLDVHIDSFRAEYPLVAGSVTPTQPGEAVEAVAARNVVDGLALATAWRTNPSESPADLASGLPASGPEAESVAECLDALLGALDALSDLSLYESAFQSIQGKFERAGAALDAMAGTGRPPEPESVRTPTEGLRYGNRLCLVLPETDPSDGETSPRAAAEPALEAWLAGILGDLDSIVCRASFPERDGTDDWMDVSIEDLGLGALDFMYACAATPRGEGTEIELRIASYVRGTQGLSPATRLYLDFGRRTGSRSMGEAIELSQRILALVGNATALRPADLAAPAQNEDPAPSAGAPPPVDTASYSSTDYAELRDRAGAARDMVGEIMTALAGPATGLGAALHRASLLGVEGAIPAVASDPAELEALRGPVISSLQNRLNDCDELLPAEADPVPANIGKGIDTLVQAMKALLGRSFIVLPSCAAPDGLEAAAERTDHLGAGGAERVETWLQETAHVRTGMQRLETVLLLSRAWQSAPGSTLASYEAGVNLNSPAGGLRAIQLPADAQASLLRHSASGWAESKVDAKWMALSDAEWRAIYQGEGVADLDSVQLLRPRGLMSIAVLAPEGVDFSGRVAGLMIERWDEQIPSDGLTTGISFHYDQPASQAPQSLLLAVPGDTSGMWKHEEVFAVVRDTMKLAQIRMVDLDALSGVGRLTPALFVPMNPVMPMLDFVGKSIAQLVPIAETG